MMKTKCARCHKPKKKLERNVCIRCRLHGPFLISTFTAIVQQEQLVEFEADMEQWYLYDA